MTAPSMSKADDIRTAALAILPQLVQEWLPGGEQRNGTYVALNPLRNDRNLGSFRIDLNSGHWRDHSIGAAGGDPISLFAYLSTDGDYRQAFRFLSDHPLIRAVIATGATPLPAKVANFANRQEDRVALANRIYAGASKLPGTPAEGYLRKRGLHPTSAWKLLRTALLRHPERGWHPALLAPISALDGSISGLHRTFLQPDGNKLDEKAARLTLGRIRGCAIRLGEPTDHLIICEGLEDGLTLFEHLDGHPVWVAGGASLMPEMAISVTVRNLTIAADNDPAGERAAQAAVDAHSIQGREVRVMRPERAFKDFNDQLRGVRRDR